MAQQMFALPEYSRAFEEFVYSAINELMRRKDSVFGMIRSEKMPQLPTMRNTMPSGEVVEHQPVEFAMSFSVLSRDIIAGDPSSLITSIDNAADEGLKAFMPRLFEYMSQICDAAGTSLDAGGQRLSHDLIRQGYEKVEIDFDDEGNPLLPSIVLHPTMAEKIRQLPPPTEEQVRAFREMIERKRQEFNDRRRRRKLS